MTFFHKDVYRDSVVGTATCYGLGGQGIEFLWDATFSTPVHTGPAADPASYKMGIVSFSGVKRPRLRVDYLPLSRAKVKERVELDVYSPIELSRSVVR